MVTVLTRAFPVFAGERLPVLVLFSHYFLVSAAVIAGKSARDAYFLTRYDKSILPLMYLANAVCVAIAIAAFSRISKKVSPSASTVLTAAFFSITLLLIELRLDSGWMIGVLYVWMEVIGTVVVLQSWLLTGNAFDPRQAKRLFGVIAAGGSIAAWAGGVSIAWVAARYGSSSLITLVAAALAVSTVTAWYAARFRAPRPRSRPAPSSPRQQQRLSPYVQSIAILIAAASIVSAVIQYRFQVTAVAAYPSRNELVAFFGQFYAWTGAASLASQLFLSSFLLSRFGVIAGLFVLPASFTAGSISTLLSPSLWSAGFGRFSDLTFKFTVNNSSLEMLWLPVPPEERQAVKPLVSGTLKAVSEAGTAILLFILVKFTPVWVLSVFAISVCAVWLWTVVRLRGQYTGALLRVIEKRQLDPEALRLSATDPLVVDSIDRSLRSPDESEQIAALGFLDGLPLAPWRTALQDLLAIGSPEIRERVLLLAANDRHAIRDEAVLAIAKTTGAAANTAMQIAAERGIPGIDDVLGAHLHSSDSRASTVAGSAILRYHVGDQVAARATLHRWLNSDNSAAVAHVLRLLPRDEALLPPPMLALFLRHPAPEVRCAAIAAVAARKHRELLPEVIAALSDARCLRAARLALREMPPQVVSRMLMRVVIESTDGRLRCAAIRVLREYAASVAEGDLAAHLHQEDLNAWSEFADLLRAVSHLRPVLPTVADRAREQCSATCAQAYLFDAMRSQLDRDPDAILFSDHVVRRYNQALGTTLRLTALRYPALAVDACLQAADSGDRALLPYVLELLDTTLGVDDRRLLGPLIEPQQVERRRLILRELFLTPDLHIERQIENAASSPDRWESAVARDYLTRKGKRAPSRANESTLQEEEMYSLLEKTIIFKSSEVFGRLPADNLATLSAIATEIRLPSGAVLFREGDAGDCLYLLVSGRVRIVKGHSDIALLSKGSCLGEMAVLDQAPRSADAIVDDEAVLLRIESGDFYEALAESPNLAQGLVRLLSRRLREANTRIAQAHG